MNVLRAIYRFWMALIVLALIVQIGAAGYGAFYAANHLKNKTGPLSHLRHKKWDDAWSFHGGLGTIIVAALIVALILALVARIGPPRIWFQLGLAVAGILQIVFAAVGTDHPKVGVLHPLNAFLILALSGFLTRTAWLGARRPVAA